MNAEAKLYKWVDDNGITHYGEIIPPEYANKNRDSLDKAGMIEKKSEKTSPEAMRAKEEADKKLQIEKQAAIEQQRRDNTLLNTYSNEKEIDMALDRSLLLINARIDSNKMLLSSSQGTLDELQKESEQRIKEGKKIPASLTNDIAKTEARVAKYSTELAKSEEELNAVKLRFEHDKELYRKLKGSAAQK
jgi:carboxypeptidase C (cathepsin A)